MRWVKEKKVSECGLGREVETCMQETLSRGTVIIMICSLEEGKVRLMLNRLGWA